MLLFCFLVGHLCAPLLLLLLDDFAVVTRLLLLLLGLLMLLLLLVPLFPQVYGEGHETGDGRLGRAGEHFIAPLLLLLLPSTLSAQDPKLLGTSGELKKVAAEATTAALGD